MLLYHVKDTAVVTSLVHLDNQVKNLSFVFIISIQVIRQLGSQNLQFRILALSATPGGDTKVRIKSFFRMRHQIIFAIWLSPTLVPSPLLVSLQSVQLVISNLLISHIELRSEESPDIRAHTHQRNVEKIVVPLGEKLAAYQACYLQVGPPSSASYLANLCSLQKRFLWHLSLSLTLRTGPKQ